PILQTPRHVGAMFAGSGDVAIAVLMSSMRLSTGRIKMQALRLVGFVVTLLLAGSVYAAVDDAIRISAARKIAGKKSYLAYCVSCHGETAAGNGPTAVGRGLKVPDFTTPQAVVAYDYDRMVAAIRTGHDEATRGTWTAVTSDDAGRIVSFLREAFMMPAPVADASTGRSIYAKTCSVCHGDRGDGATWAKHGLDPSPFNFTSAKGRELSRRHMINTVTYGSPRTAMVGFSTQLSREEIAAVVDYVRSTFVYASSVPTSEKPVNEIPKAGNPRAAVPGSVSSAAVPTGPLQHGIEQAANQQKVPASDEPADMKAAMPEGLVGDAAAGRTFYNNNCFVCHGKEGRGDGPRAYFINPKPANLTDEAARRDLNRPTLYRKISMGVNGTEMPAWSKVLDRQQVANLAEYVFGTFIRPAPETSAKKK
ncbi:MAG: c-type cytochrome, partial [Alphaproteobacteria bacterium]